MSFTIIYYFAFSLREGYFTTLCTLQPSYEKLVNKVFNMPHYLECIRVLLTMWQQRQVTYEYVYMGI